MTKPSYNQAILELAQAAMSDLAKSNADSKTKRNAAAESHFLCSWMAKSLKEHRFSKLVADDLTQWIRLGRSMGAGADLNGLMQSIVTQYQKAEKYSQDLGKALKELVQESESQDWLVVTDTELSGKLKLDGDGQTSLVICAKELELHIEADALIKPIRLYYRGNEAELITLADKHGLMLSQPNKKTSLIKHHKTYKVYPNNQQPALALLP